jgi:hypothetical protein
MSISPESEAAAAPERNGHGLRLLAELNELAPFKRPGLGLAESAYQALRQLLIRQSPDDLQ